MNCSATHAFWPARDDPWQCQREHEHFGQHQHWTEDFRAHWDDSGASSSHRPKDKDWPEGDYVCDYCGILAEPWKWSGKRVDLKACFHCNHWLRIKEEHSKHGLWFVIDGSSYIPYKFKPGGGTEVGVSDDDVRNRGGYGFDGALRRILKDGQIYETNNLWGQGRVPAHFRGTIPDNAEFVREHK